MSVFSYDRTCVLPTCLAAIVITLGMSFIKLRRQHHMDQQKEPSGHDISIAVVQLKDMFPATESLAILSLLVAAGVGETTMDDTQFADCIDRVVQHLLHGTPIHSYSAPIDGNYDEAVTMPNKTTTIECPCCCDDLAIEEFGACRDGSHLYCVSCIRRHAEALVFGACRLGNNTTAIELSCIHPECESTFAESTIQRVMEEKAMERYSELQGSLNVKQAQLVDLYDCPSCTFQALCQEKVFSCPNCHHESCRECRRPSHHPLSCVEAVERETDQNRWNMEEAMTNALVRPCPTCNKLLIKDDGCNKLVCTCGTFVCNVCKKQIDGYGHFCRTFNCQHERCGMCGLWSSTDQDDQRAIDEAGRAGEKAAQPIAIHLASASAALQAKASVTQPQTRKGILRRLRFQGRQNA